MPMLLSTSRSVRALLAVRDDETQKSLNSASDGVQVASSTGEEIFFKIKRSTKLSKLQGAYANKVGKDVGSIR